MNEADYEGEAEPDCYDRLDRDAALRIGAVLENKWRLDSLLGVGGAAAVYVGTHSRNGSRVAIKILHPEHIRNPAVWSRFQREARVANLVEHPGVARVLDDGECEDGAPYLVMDLLDGETLRDRLDREGDVLARDDALFITHWVLDVLAAAHAKGIVHRDINPMNVFLTKRGDVMVLDFGIARLLDGFVLTGPNEGPIGTPGFMSPEQAAGRAIEIDAQSDIWSVGATLFSMLTGRLVHEVPTVPEQLLRTSSVPPPPLRSIDPDTPPPLADLVDRALALDKSERWPDAASMQGALDKLLAATSVPGSALEKLLLAPPSSGSGAPKGLATRRVSSVPFSRPLPAFRSGPLGAEALERLRQALAGALQWARVSVSRAPLWARAPLFTKLGLGFTLLFLGAMFQRCGRRHSDTQTNESPRADVPPLNAGPLAQVPERHGDLLVQPSPPAPSAIQVSPESPAQRPPVALDPPPRAPKREARPRPTVGPTDDDDPFSTRH